LNKIGNYSSSNSAGVESAVIELGVGKNMVSAMRYWSESCGVISIKKGTSNQELTNLGKYLFISEDSLQANCEGKKSWSARDPFLEKKGTIWLIHFLLNFHESDLTSYRYFFNLASLQQFDKEKLVLDIESDVQHYCEKPVKLSSLKKDIDCFLHSYCTKKIAAAKSDRSVNEDHFSSPLSELKLINELGKHSYVALLEERPDLPTEIFVYALHRFITETKLAHSSSFDALLSDQNSPGKIFRLSERGLGIQIETAVSKFPNLLKLEDSQGLRQLKLVNTYPNEHNFFELLDIYYGERT
jgi:hypothetical protein